MISAPLWKAVALSLDIEPDPGRPLDHYSDEFAQRLKVAINHADHQMLSTTTGNSRGIVKIDDFVTWVMQHPGWNLPSEMSPPSGGRRGPRPRKQDQVAEKMRAAITDDTISLASLRSMKEVEMEAEFSASRDTCRKARNLVLAEFAAGNSDK